jgi:hypothetical protein
MAFCLVTCPESAHLELIECEETPFGIVIAGCSSFRGSCAGVCPRTCAARLDRRASRGLPDDDEVLVVGDTTNVDVLGMLRG